jgi:L-amino acid N-acyltransferase YncA
MAAIFGHYVTTSVVTSEETPPDLAHWRHAFRACRARPAIPRLRGL